MKLRAAGLAGPSARQARARRPRNRGRVIVSAQLAAVGAGGRLGHDGHAQRPPGQLGEDARIACLERDPRLKAAPGTRLVDRADPCPGAG
jgi:hypothetical protein